MRKADITTPIIEKCEQLAKHWRMEIYEGCWVEVTIGRKTVCHTVGYIGEDALYRVNTGLALFHVARADELLPIPSISDCLEKLRELNWYPEMAWITEPRVRIDYLCSGKSSQVIQIKQGDTLHEALLSALLEAVKK